MVASVALMAAFVMGIVFSIIGALKLELAKILKIDNAKVGGLISALMFTTMILVLVIGPLVDIFGHKPFAVFGYIVVFIGAFLLIAAKSYRAAVFACVLMGIGGTCLTTIGNLLMTVVLFNGENPPAALNLGNTFFGLGAFFAPFAIGILLRKFGYKVTGNVIAFILLIPVIFAVAAHGYPDVMTDFQISQAFGLLKKGIVIMCALTLFCYVGLEISMGSWISSYASGLGFSNRSSNLALSSYWICLMLGRLIAAGFGVKPIVTPEIGSIVSITLAAAAVVVIGIMTLAKSKSVGLAGIILTGLVFGPIYPTVLGMALADPLIAPIQGSAFGIIFAIGLLGASTIPAAIGIYSKGKTIQQSFKIAIAAAFIMLIMIVIMAQF